MGFRVALLGRRARFALALATCGLLGLGAASASAVIVHLTNGRSLSYMRPSGGALTSPPFDEVFSNADYHGGAIMPVSTDYAVYWDPAGGPAYPPEYEAGIDQYFTDLAHDSGGHENVDSVSAQYNDAAGEFASYDAPFGGALVDSDPYPANGCSEASRCLTEAQLETEIEKFVKAEHLPIDLNHEYFLITPPGVEDCITATSDECTIGTEAASFCAYHTDIPVGESYLVWANEPYVTDITNGEGQYCDSGDHPNDSTSDGLLAGGLVHEHNESITDPVVLTGWFNFSGDEEVGDKCAYNYGKALGKAPDGAAYNQVINGHFYFYQEMWSDLGHDCLQRLSFSGTEPTAKFTSTPGGEDEVKLNATGSSASGGIARYEWQFNDEGYASDHTETKSPTVSHTFPGTGTYRVALTVFAANGTSIGTAHEVGVGVTVGEPKPTTLKTLLSGEAKSGEKLTVKTGSPVGDRATLSGANSASAGGSVTYRVFSDAKCTKQAAEGGTVSVSAGSIPSSNVVVLLPGQDRSWKRGIDAR